MCIRDRALSVNRNLESYGYTLSTDAISALAKLPAQEICGVYNDLTDIIKEYKEDTEQMRVEKENAIDSYSFELKLSM